MNEIWVCFWLKPPAVWWREGIACDATGTRGLVEVINIDKLRDLYPSFRQSGLHGFHFFEMNLFWGAKFDHNTFVMPRKWVGLRMRQCPKWKQMPDSQRSWTKRIWEDSVAGFELPKLTSANAEASETQRRIQWATDPAWLAEVCPFFPCLWRGYLPTCRNVLLGVCMTYHFCLEYVCMKFGSRTDWWNRGLILFFSSCPRWGLTLIWLKEGKPKHWRKLTILIYDLKQMTTSEDETDCWWLSAFFWVLGLNSYRHHRCSFCPRQFCGQPTIREVMVDTGSHLTVGIYCKLFRLCSFGEANSMRIVTMSRL
jgi:hypothetical protein